MSPILQTLANGSARGYGAFFGAGAAPSFESIASFTATNSSTLNFTFSSIPQTYQHLQLRRLSRDAQASIGNSSMRLNFNSDTGNNYTLHRMNGNGSTASAVGYATGTYQWINVAGSPGDSSPANLFGASIIDIHDYADTSKYKTTRWFGGVDRYDLSAGSAVCELASALWLSTSAITSLTVESGSGIAFVTGSTFALYGIKGA